MKFEFATATRIIFGPGTLQQVGGLASELSRRALVVTGRDSRRAEPLRQLLTAGGVTTSFFPVSGEPDLNTITNGVAQAKAEGCELVISFGGGSALDAGKAIAAMLTNPGELLDYLEVIGHGHALPNASAPFIAIPTTAGTGSEVTRNSVLASPEHQVKISLRSPHLLPKVALVDPELTYNLPPNITASTGLDALTQLIEPFASSRANPMTDALCRAGIRRVARSFRAAFHDGQNPAAREDMSLASLFGGLALANAGLGAVHGFAGPIGGRFPAPHGAICAALLPHVMETNVRALSQRQPESESVRRYEEVAQLLIGNPKAHAQDGISWVRQLVTELEIPPLRTYGLSGESTPELVAQALKASSMKANPIALMPDELSAALEAAL